MTSGLRSDADSDPLISADVDGPRMTHRSPTPTPVSWVSETRCHYTSPGQDVRPGDQGREGATDVCEHVGGSTSPGSGMHAAAYFRGNKDRRNV